MTTSTAARASTSKLYHCDNQRCLFTGSLWLFACAVDSIAAAAVDLHLFHFLFLISALGQCGWSARCTHISHLAQSLTIIKWRRPNQYVIFQFNGNDECKHFRSKIENSMQLNRLLTLAYGIDKKCHRIPVNVPHSITSISMANFTSYYL